MKTYISLSGFDSSQVVSLIVKYGVEGGDRIILIRPEEETDTRGEQMVQAIRDLSLQIDSSIDLQVHRVDHRDFEGMIISLKTLLQSIPEDGQIIANLSGGPREIFLAFAIACLSLPQKISRATCYSDIDRKLNDLTLPNIASHPEEIQKKILRDVLENGPTTIKEIALRLSLSESTISRQVARLAALFALDAAARGKRKEVRITLTGKLLI